MGLGQSSAPRAVDDGAFTVAGQPVYVGGALADETATDSVDEGDSGAVRMTLDRKAIVARYAHAAGGATPFKLIGAATTNATSVKGSAGKISTIIVNNVNAAVRYLKLYNKATAPSVGTDVPVMTIALPAASNQVITFPEGLQFTTGIALALTTGVGDADATAVAVNEQVVNIAYT